MSYFYPSVEARKLSSNRGQNPPIRDSVGGKVVHKQPIPPSARKVEAPEGKTLSQLADAILQAAHRDTFKNSPYVQKMRPGQSLGKYKRIPDLVGPYRGELRGTGISGVITRRREAKSKYAPRLG
jgi:hypothetical protein